MRGDFLARPVGSANAAAGAAVTVYGRCACEAALQVGLLDCRLSLIVQALDHPPPLYVLGGLVLLLARRDDLQPIVRKWLLQGECFLGRCRQPCVNAIDVSRPLSAFGGTWPGPAREERRLRRPRVDATNTGVLSFASRAST
jgi:hypothetical protein